MADFPRLQTDAVCQYPMRRARSHRTEVVRFGDGSEQRYRDFAAPIRAWAITLALLTEEELRALEVFFWSNQGAAGTFTFTDPLDGVVHENCEFASDTLPVALDETGRGATAIIVRERRS
jgi:phage-related protein